METEGVGHNRKNICEERLRILHRTISSKRWRRFVRLLKKKKKKKKIVVVSSFAFLPTYDKLCMFGIRVHDGASHFVVYAKVARNKNAETIFSTYLEFDKIWCSFKDSFLLCITRVLNIGGGISGRGLFFITKMHFKQWNMMGY